MTRTRRRGRARRGLSERVGCPAADAGVDRGGGFGVRVTVAAAYRRAHNLDGRGRWCLLQRWDDHGSLRMTRNPSPPTTAPFEVQPVRLRAGHGRAVIPPESLDRRHSPGYAAGDRQQAVPLVLPWIHLPLLQKQRGDSVGITTLNPLTQGAERLKRRPPDLPACRPGSWAGHRHCGQWRWAMTTTRSRGMGSAAAQALRRPSPDPRGRSASTFSSCGAVCRSQRVRTADHPRIGDS